MVAPRVGRMVSENALALAARKRKKCGRRPMKTLHVARGAHPTAPEAGALRETGRSAPLSKSAKAIGLCYKSVRTWAGRPFPLVFAPHTNVSTGVDFRSCLRGSGVSPDMERHTPAGETPALHFRSLKGIIFCASHTLLAHQDGIFLPRPPSKQLGKFCRFGEYEMASYVTPSSRMPWNLEYQACHCLQTTDEAFLR